MVPSTKSIQRGASLGPLFLPCGSIRSCRIRSPSKTRMRIGTGQTMRPIAGRRRARKTGQSRGAERDRTGDFLSAISG
jgi:hypothetical protein